jgi:nitrile hydratase accessory protein
MDVDREIGDMSSAAMPRANGELVFEEPWQGRAFGMAITLNRTGLYEWDEFRARLILEIAANDGEESGPTPYYRSWLAAFERLLVERGLVSATELARRQAEFRDGRRNEVF